MKNLLTIAIIIFKVQNSLAQTDSVKVLNEEFFQYTYNDVTKSVNPSYNYSNKWDFDGDKKKDSLFFIGNGGTHSYFYPRIILSTDGLTRNFPTVQIDMPYFTTSEILKKWNKSSAVQFVVDDFDNNGTIDIYLNFNNPFGHIPKTWKTKGVKTKYVLFSCAGKKLNIKDYY